MPKAYLIASVIITDPQVTTRYIAATAEVLAKFGARHLINSQTAVIKEGLPGTRLAVFEFETLDRANAFWDSPDYAGCKKLREGAMERDFIIVEAMA